MKDAQKVMAKASFVTNSPRKLRLVADAVRNMEPTKAVELLKNMPGKSVGPMLKVFKQALGNVKNNFKLSPADMKISTLQVNEGPRGSKKADVHAHGARFGRGIRRKKTSHIILELVTK